MKLSYTIFKCHVLCIFIIFFCNAYQVNILVNTGSGYGLVPSGNEPQPELVLVKMHIVRLRH